MTQRERQLLKKKKERPLSAQQELAHKPGLSFSSVAVLF